MWANCFNELAHEMKCYSYTLFDNKNEFDIFSKLILDKTYHKNIAINESDIISLNTEEKAKILNRYDKYNLQQLTFHNFRNNEGLNDYSFMDHSYTLIRKYEDFLKKRDIQVLFFMEPQSLNITSNAIIMEMVCNELGIKVRLAHYIGGWTNIGIFNNLHRSSEKINKTYKQNLELGLSAKEEKKVTDYFEAYDKFKSSDFATRIIYKKTLNKKISIKSFLRNLYYAPKNFFSKSIFNDKYLYDEYDIYHNKYILFLPNKNKNKRARYLSPFYSNYSSIIENLLISLPVSYSLIIKDHPHSMAGNIDESMVELVKNSDNCFYINPNISTFKVIDNADIVISVASSSVIEALIKFKHVIMFGKKVFTFGEYEAPIKRITNFEDLPEILRSCVNSPPPKKEIVAYFHALLTHTRRGGDVDDDDWCDFSKRTGKNFDIKRIKTVKESIRAALKLNE
ncbi:hypothetical protein N9I76_00685 [Candidatus Thioglobus sp.]|nr:hypothetical protein [Candidatus Thioglobus sp.]MDA8872014.1 hypothetical protein [Candidatus Thioglobus sp.]